MKPGDATQGMSFELQPFLQGELVRLRPLVPDDFAALYAVAADPLIWEQHPASDRYKEPVFKEFFREGLASGGCVAEHRYQHRPGHRVVARSRIRRRPWRDRARVDFPGTLSL